MSVSPPATQAASSRVYDDNGISIDGKVSGGFTDTPNRFESLRLPCEMSMARCRKPRRAIKGA